MMTYGHLTVVCGPMYSSKTTELLKRVLWAKNGRGRNVLVVKPAMDKRYSETDIVTHDGLSVSCHPISLWEEVEAVADRAEVVFLDELQFFTAPHFHSDIVEVTSGLLRSGKDVVANGLDLDVHGRPFETTATLMAMADEVIKLKAICSVCGRNATKTFKLVENEARVELGSIGMYEPRCNEHWS